MQHKLDTEKLCIYDCLTPFTLWNNLSTFSCLNISTLSKNGMLIDVTHKLGYYSSNLIRKKKRNTNQLDFLFLFMVISAHLGGLKSKCPSQLQLILPSINVPKETSSFHLLPWWLSGSQSLFKLLPRAPKQHAQQLPRETRSLPHPSHWGNTQTQPFLVWLRKNTRACLTLLKAETYLWNVNSCHFSSKAIVYAGKRGNK